MTSTPSSSLLHPAPTDADACPPEVRRSQAAHVHVPSTTGIRSRNVARCEQLNLTGQVANSIRFPFNGFTYFLTLFSKSFSSFPHGTCSLSVSCQYLALDEVYYPFWAAFPTLRTQIASALTLPRTGLSPYTTCRSKQLMQAGLRREKCFSKLQFVVATQRRLSS